MKKYLPSKTESQMLTIGIAIGVVFGVWFPNFLGTFPIIAPFIIIASIMWYLHYKQKQVFEVDLLKAKVLEEVTKKD